MFIIRRITSEGNEINMVLGESYHVVDEKRNTEEFIKAKDLLQIDNSEGQIFCILFYKNGSEFYPLYKKSTYYIMTENGSTFANLTFK